MPILSTHNLEIGYLNNSKKNVVLSNLNLTLEAGELVALIGANGVGKSTLLRTIAGSQQPLQGDIEINGINLKRFSKSQISRELGIVYTDRTHAGGLTVRELVALGRQPHTGFLGWLSQHDYEVVDKAIISAGIAHKANNYVAELSDGERQKAMIAKTLAQETSIIILDEPTAFLDVASRIDTIKLLHSLARETNKAILLSTHDISQTVLLVDKLWIATPNHELITGTTEDLILNGDLNRMFSSSNIEFDLNSGDFQTHIDTHRSVALSCNSTAVNHWLTNALQRNGYSRAINSGTSSHVHSHNNYTIVIDGTEHSAQSIHQLLSLLHNQKN